MRRALPHELEPALRRHVRRLAQPAQAGGDQVLDALEPLDLVPHEHVGQREYAAHDLRELGVVDGAVHGAESSTWSVAHWPNASCNARILAFAYLLLVHLPLVAGAAVIPLMGLPLLFLPIHIVWLELVIHPTALLAFQDLPAPGPLAVLRQERRVRFFSTGAWLCIVLTGAIVSAAVVWSYLHALGADRDVEHARAMALAVLLAASAAITAGLTRLRQAGPRWLVLATLASLGVLVQVPALSGWLHLRPLHAGDWALVAGAFAAVGLLALAVKRQVHGS